MCHLQDSRLTKSETKNLLARRYFDTGRSLGRHDPEKMNKYFDRAQKMGFSKITIYKHRLKRNFRNTFRSFWLLHAITYTSIST